MNFAEPDPVDAWDIGADQRCLAKLAQGFERVLAVTGEVIATAKDVPPELAAVLCFSLSTHRTPIAPWSPRYQQIVWVREALISSAGHFSFFFHFAQSFHVARKCGKRGA